MSNFSKHRDFLKDSLRKKINFRRSDQSSGMVAPRLQEPFDEDAPRVSLPGFRELRAVLKERDVFEVIAGRRSRRRFNDEFLQIEELAFLLFATQGLRNPEKEPAHFRTVPSAGARHSFETYLFLSRVESLAAGLYRYLPLSHELVLQYPTDNSYRQKLSRAAFGQNFIGEAAAVFVWTTVPYRMEWRYLEAAHRVILLDAGHVCQNLYLACEAIGAGTCAIAAYDQDAIDELLQIDGKDHFTVYLAPVGKY